MRAVIVTQPGKIAIKDIPVPVIGPYQALVKTEVAFLCNSTDSKLVAGHFPGVEKYPLMLGHESAGIVQKVGDKVRNFKPGDRVIGGLVFDCGDSEYNTGWGGFCEYTIANDHDAMVADGVANEANGWFEVYEIQRTVALDINAEYAALLCTWREVYGGFGDFNLQPGQNILIFGAGAVGLSFLKFARLLNLGFVGIVDPLPIKRENALKMGADAVFTPDSPEIGEIAQKIGRPLDAVIDAVGHPSIVNRALPLIKMGGSICVYGVISDENFVLNKAKGPYNFNLYMHQWPTRFREKAAQEPLCNWIREKKINPAEFITHEFKMEQINEAFASLKNGDAIKVLLRF